MKILHFINHTILLMVNLLAIGLLLLADVAWYVSPEYWYLPGLTALAYEWIVIGNVLIAILWLFSQRKSYCVLSLLCLLVSFPQIRATWACPWFQTVPEPVEGSTPKQLSILTYNTMGYGNLSPVNSNAEYDWIREQDADVLCLQEFVVNRSGNHLRLDELKKHLSLYPYTYFCWRESNATHQYGLAVFSKYPLCHGQEIQYGSASNLSAQCDVVAYGDTIRLITNHLESDQFSEKDLAIRQADLATDSVRRIATLWAGKLRVANQKRAAQVQIVRDVIEHSPYPMIVVGDFNDVPASYTYHTLSHGLEDAYMRANWLKTGHTFYKHHVGIRIDYVLHSPSFAVLSADRPKVDYSDHYPVRATLCW